MAPSDKPLVWLRGEVKSPPFSPAARLEAGFLLRQLQAGAQLSLPHYRLDPDAVILADVFAKKTPATPKHVITACQRLLRQYDDTVSEE
jgi:hypothetical protein